MDSDNDDDDDTDAIVPDYVPLHPDSAPARVAATGVVAVAPEQWWQRGETAGGIVVASWILVVCCGLFALAMMAIQYSRS